MGLFNKIFRRQCSPFHKGELAVQERLKAREMLTNWADKAIRPYFLEQHQTFFEQLPFIVVAACDEKGLPWVTLLTGNVGFIDTKNTKQLHMKTQVTQGDALEKAFVEGADIGLIGIELESRRRNRANGYLSKVDDSGITFSVSQSFGNCPQYISERPWRTVEIEKTSVSRHSRLTQSMQKQISTADTLFLASGYLGERKGKKQASFGMDASHRGGPAGFVTVINDRQLVLPDYSGNNFYNTIGNLVLNPLIGLLFIDFDTGSLLQITGKASIDWDSDKIQEHQGALRLLNIEIDEIVELKGVLPLRWGLPKAIEGGLKVSKRIEESNDVTSFELVANKQTDLPSFRAGQHLPIQLTLSENKPAIERTYSLSNSPSDEHYRISVKRQEKGIVSQYLHDSIQVGDVIQAKQPNGEFLLKFPTRPIILISAGIGITPLISMLHAAIESNISNAIRVFYCAPNSEHAPLLEEIQQLEKQHNNMNLHVIFSQPNEQDLLAGNHQKQGRINGEYILQNTPNTFADFYLCGPRLFLNDLTSELEELGVQRAAINYESF